MRTQTRPGAHQNGHEAGGERSLPPVTVARLEQASLLLERLVQEKQTLFVEAGQRFRETHRENTSRPLTPAEAAQIAAGLAAELGGQLGENPGAVVQKIQESGLRAYDDPEPAEVLLAAGIGTAPAFMDIALRLTALVELAPDVFEDACENGTLDEALRVGADDIRACELSEARGRAEAAAEHVSEAAGVSSGEARGLLTRSIGQALKKVLELSPSLNGSGLSSLIGSLEPTDGDDETSSTGPPSEKP